MLKKGQGPRVQIGPGAEAAFETDVLAVTLKAGFPTEHWTLERVSELIDKEFEICYYPKGLAPAKKSLAARAPLLLLDVGGLSFLELIGMVLQKVALIG